MVEVASDGQLAELLEPAQLIKAMFGRLTEERQEIVRIAVLDHS